MNHTRYADNWGKRIGLHFPYDPAINVALKAAIKFPDLKFEGNPPEGVPKCWSITDKPDSIQKAHKVLADFGHFLDVEPATGDEDVPIAVSTDAGLSVTFIHPDTLVMKWPYKSNYVDINRAVKSMGSAKFDGTMKTWTIPVADGPTIAAEVREHYSALADAILAVPQTTIASEQQQERKELSNAVEVTEEQRLIVEEHIPESLREIARPYQLVSPAMYVTGDRNRVLIADEMGLGKSLQALLCTIAGQHQRVLIVCPAVVKLNWRAEIDKWLDTTVEVISGRDGPIAYAHYTVINYDIISDRAEQLRFENFDCIIFDECHALKNKESKRTKAAMSLSNWPTVKGLICLSGTPILNRPAEFYTVLSMLMPGTFNNWATYVKKYCGAFKGLYGWVYSGATNIEQSEDGSTQPLTSLLADLMVRRTMDDPRLAETMPSLLQSTLMVEFDERQRATYDNHFNGWMSEWEQFRDLGSGSMPPGWVLNMLTDVRHFTGKLKVETAVNWAHHYWVTSSKPLVIFAHHVDVLTGVSDGLRAFDPHSQDFTHLENNPESRVGLIDGSTPMHKRQALIEMFQKGSLPFLVCSTLAMKEGVNLDRADTTLFVEREWVPAWESQAAARVRRMTQESAVCHQVILSARDTIDEHFDKVVEAKAEVVAKALGPHSELRREHGHQAAKLAQTILPGYDEVMNNE